MKNFRLKIKIQPKQLQSWGGFFLSFFFVEKKFSIHLILTSHIKLNHHYYYYHHYLTFNLNECLLIMMIIRKTMKTSFHFLFYMKINDDDNDLKYCHHHHHRHLFFRIRFVYGIHIKDSIR